MKQPYLIEQYYEYVSDELSNYHNLQYGYNNESVMKYNMLVWNADDLKNKKIKQTHNTLTVTPLNSNPIKSGVSLNTGSKLRSFSTLKISNYTK